MKLDEALIKYNEIDKRVEIKPFWEVRDIIESIGLELEALQNRSCVSCKSCRQYSDLGLCDIQRGYVNMNLIKYCGRWTSKC